MIKALFIATLLFLSGSIHARPPNIIIILADDLGYGSVGCYGATKVKTPNIDRIGLRNHFYCPPTLTPANRDRKANWAYEKWTEPLEEGLVR